MYLEAVNVGENEDQCLLDNEIEISQHHTESHTG